jgi:hypothetical protein
LGTVGSPTRGGEDCSEIFVRESETVELDCVEAKYKPFGHSRTSWAAHLRHRNETL